MEKLYFVGKLATTHHNCHSAPNLPPGVKNATERQIWFLVPNLPLYHCLQTFNLLLVMINSLTLARRIIYSAYCLCC